MEHLYCERRLSLLHQGVHRVKSSAPYNFLHAAELMLEALEPLLPRSLPFSLLMGVQFVVSNMPPECCFVALLSRGSGWSVPPGLARFRFCFNTSRSARVWLPFVTGDVTAFLSLPRLPRSLHLPALLVGEVECLHLLRVSLHCF